LRQRPAARVTTPARTSGVASRRQRLQRGRDSQPRAARARVAPWTIRGDRDAAPCRRRDPEPGDRAPRAAVARTREGCGDRQAGRRDRDRDALDRRARRAAVPAPALGRLPLPAPLDALHGRDSLPARLPPRLRAGTGRLPAESGLLVPVPAPRAARPQRAAPARRLLEHPEPAAARLLHRPRPRGRGGPPDVEHASRGAPRGAAVLGAWVTIPAYRPVISDACAGK